MFQYSFEDDSAWMRRLAASEHLSSEVYRLRTALKEAKIINDLIEKNITNIREFLWTRKKDPVQDGECVRLLADLDNLFDKQKDKLKEPHENEVPADTVIATELPEGQIQIQGDAAIMGEPQRCKDFMGKFMAVMQLHLTRLDEALGGKT